jgi:hypothetical protein
MKKTWVLETAFLVLFALAIIYQIFIPPITGLADNGDFVRIADKVGIRQGSDKQYMKFINLVFPIQPTYNVKGYQSSELIFVVISVVLNSLVAHDGLFHLNILAGLNAAALLIALAVIAFGISGTAGRVKWVIYACVLLFFTDVGYIVYLNSLYSEPASMIFLALTVGIVFVILRQISSAPVRLPWFIAFFVSSALFVLAKPQNAALGVVLAFFGYRLILLAKPDGIPQGRNKLIGGLLALSLIAGSFLFFAFGLPRYYRSGDLWNSVFLEIVGRSTTPEQDLKELGLPASMIAYKGTYAFSDNVNRNIYDDFQHSWLYFKIFEFYLVHPGRLVSLIQISSTSVFDLQQSNLGNFDSSSGFKSYAKSTKLIIWSVLRHIVLPESIWTLAALFLLNIAAAIIKIKKFDKTLRDRLISELHLSITLMAVVQFMTVLLAEGTFELVKHMYLFNILIDISLVFLIAYAAGLISGLLKRNSQLSPQKALP